MKKKDELPYRFTCPIPCKVAGKRELTEDEKKRAQEGFKKLEEILSNQKKEGELK